VRIVGNIEPPHGRYTPSRIVGTVITPPHIACVPTKELGACNVVARLTGEFQETTKKYMENPISNNAKNKK
jgi:hypothetical protein